MSLSGHHLSQSSAVLDKDLLTLKKHSGPSWGLCLHLLLPTITEHCGVPCTYTHTHRRPYTPSILLDCRLPFSSEFLRHDQGPLKRPIGKLASFQHFLGKSNILETFSDRRASTSFSPCSVFPKCSTPGPCNPKPVLRLELPGPEGICYLARTAVWCGGKNGRLKVRTWLNP